MDLQTDYPVLLAIGVLLVLSLLYSVLVMQAPLAWASFVAPLVFLYLVWRFVRAHERIADALEARAPQPESEPDD